MELGPRAHLHSARVSTGRTLCPLFMLPCFWMLLTTPSVAQQPGILSRGMTLDEVRAALGEPVRQPPEPSPGQPVAETGSRAASPRTDSIPSRAARQTLQAYRIRGDAVIVDGWLNEPEWTEAEAATDFIQYKPRSGQPATERTEVRLLYDDHAIYVGARLYDSRPDSIVARLGRRDEDLHSDWFTVQLDSDHDRRTAFAFSVNPRGVKRDAFIYDDRRENENWDAVWNVSSRVDSLGWTAEFRIPLSQLRFGRSMAEGEEQKWGINLQRHIARKDETANWAPIPRNTKRLVSLFGELGGLRGLQPPRRIELMPYLLGRVVRAPEDRGNPFYEENDFSYLAGADLEVGIGGNLTLNATFNPDFGQVEADPSEVNLTAYETRFEEKRPFFVEGADMFRFELDRAELFYSRRIGREPQGEAEVEDGFVDAPRATRVLGAAKLSGRTAGGWSIGVLEAVTASENARTADASRNFRVEPVEPLTNYAVIRVTKSLREGQSGIGAIVTSTNRRLDDARLEFLRSAAYTGGVDVRHRFGAGNYELSGSLLGSHIVGSPDAIAQVQRAAGHYFQRPDAKHLEYDPTRTSLSGLAGSLSIARIGGGHWTWGASGRAVSPGFEVNDVGYQRGADAMYQSTFIGYSEYDPGSIFRSWDVNLSQSSSWSFGSERTSTSLGMSGSFQLLNYWGGSLGLSRQISSLSTDFLWGGPAVWIPARTDGWFSIYGDTRRRLSFQLYGSGSLQDETGGSSLGIGTSLLIRPTQATDLSLGAYVYRGVDPFRFLGLNEAEGVPRYLLGQLDQATVSLTTRLNLTFSPTVSLQAYAEPFVGAGAYSSFKEVRSFRARGLADRFYEFPSEQIVYDPESSGYWVDANGDGRRELYIYDPSFNTQALNSTVVLRWEFRPGSTMFVVWSQKRWDWRADGSIHLARDARRLFGPGLRAENVLAVKVSYWLAH